MRAKTINKRNQFLQAGKELFFEKGYISVSVKEICDKLDTTTGSFYFMFSSKEKLLEELLIESLTHLWTTGEAVAKAQKDLKSKLGNYFENALDYVIREIELMKFYRSILDETGIGAKTAHEIRDLSLKKQEENLYYLLNSHKEEINHDSKRIRDLAKYTMLILEHKQVEFIDKLIKLNNENILNTSMELKNAIKQDFVIFNNDIKLSTSSIEDKVENYIKLQDKTTINLGTKLENYFTNITKIISTLKIDNLISITNEINKYRQGVLEDEFFLQEVGHCKIIKFTDKSNNDFTEVFYNDSGEKLYAETYSEDKLKFLIKYQNDKIKDGIEFDKDGNVIFEYFYNEAEEISKKIEYEYHNNGKRIKEEVNY